jgi:hypothetical protein
MRFLVPRPETLCRWLLVLAVVNAGAGPLAAQLFADRTSASPATPPTTAPAPGLATAILPLDQVHIGAKGYGLTVFHGDVIEPFTVEVVSIMRDFAPRKGVIWVRCPEERMQKSGPVAGMSGSPIYLWSDGEAQVPGQGGKLIGAFAFGFRGTKDCYVGVQPIEYMRVVGEHLKTFAAAADPAEPSAMARGEKARDESVAIPYAGLRPFLSPAPTSQSGGQSGGSSGGTSGVGGGDKPAEYAGRSWRAAVLAEALLSGRLAKDLDRPAPPAPQGVDGRAVPMMLPVAVRSPTLTRLFAAQLESAGMIPLDLPQGLNAGLPPPDVDISRTQLKPGAVISIPLAFGDMDLSAQGTVTDVLPDGRVLAFGHPMFNEGPAAVPMATGYVHYIVPGLNSSFKLGGSGVIKGTVLRDESTAIAGQTGTLTYRTAPVHITVRMPQQPPREYHYSVVHHRLLTPLLLGLVASNSVTADEGLPLDNTARLHGTIHFAGQRTLTLDSLIPLASAVDMAAEVAPAVAALLQNPFQTVPLEKADLEIDVEPGTRAASMTEVRLDHTQAAPGQTLVATVYLQPNRHPAYTQRVEIPVPANLEDGDYSLTLCDVRAYSRMLLMTRPSLREPTSVDDVLAVAQEIEGLADDALYAVIQVPNQGLTLGGTELPLLPSSRKALIATPGNPAAAPLTALVTRVIPMNLVPMGQASFTISVRKDLKH